MSDSPESRTEAASIRRRWITLGETLAVAAVLISGLTLYLNRADRQDERADRAAESSKASARAARLVLNAQPDGEDRLALKPADPNQMVQSQTILFPRALGIAAVETSGEARIEAGWFEAALKKAREAAKLPDDSIGDEKLPVVIMTRFIVNGDTHDDSAIYDIGYGIAGKWLSGHRLSLRGLSLVTHAGRADAQARIDAHWARQTKR